MSGGSSSLERRANAIGRVALAFEPGSPERRELARLAGLYLHFGVAREFLRARKLLDATDPSPEILARVRERTPPRFDDLPDELFLAELNEAYGESPAALPSRPPTPTARSESAASTQGFFEPLPSDREEIEQATAHFERIRSQAVEPSEERDALDRAVRVYFVACRVLPLRALIETEWAALRRIGESGYSDDEAEHLRRFGIDPETGGDVDGS